MQARVKCTMKKSHVALIILWFDAWIIPSREPLSDMLTITSAFLVNSL